MLGLGGFLASAVYFRNVCCAVGCVLGMCPDRLQETEAQAILLVGTVSVRLTSLCVAADVQWL
jgi:hypothetical protein